MPDNDSDSNAFMSRLLELPPGPERDQMLSDLQNGSAPSETSYDEAMQLLRTADLLWLDSQEPPPIEDDAVAAMLGLVPDSQYQLDAKSFKRARQAARLEPTVLARALSRRGWNVSVRDVFNWDLRGSTSLEPALVRVIAEVLRTDPDRLTADPKPARPVGSLKSEESRAVAAEAASSPRFRSLVERFARVQEMSVRMAESALHSRMLATVHRGEHPTSDQMLASVEALVEALEASDHR
jgi:hypothetical protein